MLWTRLAALSLTGLSAAVILPTIGLGVAAHQVPDFIRHPRPTASPAPTSSVAASDIGQQIVAAHNQWRSKVGVAPVRWSNTLATYAQEWANYLAANNKFQHRTNNKYGENLFWAQGRRWSASEVVNSWGSEVKDYTYSNNKCGGVCGHYTQIVWRNTTEVGCAVARSGSQEVWVCNYNPPGNYIGQRPY